MKRRQMLRNSAAFGLIGALPLARALAATTDAATAVPKAPQRVFNAGANRLTPPAHGAIPVAFLISDGAVVIDFSGPWEVFGNVMIGNSEPFHCYTVAETSGPITASGGMKIVPNYTIADAPAPKIVVIPAQSDPSAAVLGWIRNSARNADVTMSVCTGAFVLAQTGLLAGKSATTHHGAYVELALKYPDINVRRGARFVEDGNLASAGGLSSGIDLALRTVERYFGRDVASQTAYNMEYQGQGWKDPASNSAYAAIRTSANGHPLCVVCAMTVDPATAPKSIYQKTTYYFCSTEHKHLFDNAPQEFVAWSSQSGDRKSVV